MTLTTDHIYLMHEPDRGWMLPGFAYLFNKHWEKGQNISVVSCNGIGTRLPDNFAVYQVRKRILYSDILIDFLKSLECKFLILFHENDWIRSGVNLDKVQTLYDWANAMNGPILRIDLTDGRACCREARHWKGPAPHGIDLMYTPPGAEGLMTFTPSIWNRELLLSVLVSGESQVQAEQGAAASMRTRVPGVVMGVKQSLLDYLPVNEAKINLNGFDQNTVDYMRHRGYLRKP